MENKELLALDRDGREGSEGRSLSSGCYPWEGKARWAVAGVKKSSKDLNLREVRS